MNRIFWAIVTILVLALPLPVAAQISRSTINNPQIILVASAPSGSCSANFPDQQTITAGIIYTCQAGTWTAIGGGGGGGNLSGTLTATHLPLATGTNTLGDSVITYAASTFTFPANVAIVGAYSFSMNDAGSSFNLGGPAQAPLSGSYTVIGPLSIGPQQSVFGEPLSDYIPLNASNVIAGNHTDLSSGLAIYNQNTVTSVQIAAALNPIEQVNGTASSTGIYSVGTSIPGIGNTTNEYTSGVVGQAQIGVNPGVTDVGGTPVMASLYAAANANYSLKADVLINAGLYVEQQYDQGVLNAAVYISDQSTGTSDYSEYIAGGKFFSHGAMQLDNITGHGTAGVVGIDASGNLSVSATITSSPYPAVTDASPIAWNLGSAGVTNGIVTLAHGTATRALNISNLVNGGFYTLIVKEDSTGGAAMTGGTGCTWVTAGGTGGGSFPILTSPSALNVVTFSYDGTNCYVFSTSMTAM